MKHAQCHVPEVFSPVKNMETPMVQIHNVPLNSVLIYTVGDLVFLGENIRSWYVYRNFPSSCNSYLSRCLFLFEFFVFQLCNGDYDCKFTEILEYHLICLQLWVFLLFNQTQQTYESSFTFVLLSKILNSDLKFPLPDVTYAVLDREILFLFFSITFCLFIKILRDIIKI